MGATSLSFRDFGLFSDEVYTSTDLNRRAGEVLTRANKTPVTIARNNERFALLRRDQAASLVKGFAQLVEVVQLAQGANAIQKNRTEQLAPEVTWMTAFDEEERSSMLGAIFTACAQASADNDWETV
jgi:hypothetical protein